MLYVAFAFEYQPGPGRAEDRLALDADRVYQAPCLRSSIGGDTKGESLPLREDITGSPRKRHTNRVCSSFYLNPNVEANSHAIGEMSTPRPLGTVPILQVLRPRPDHGTFVFIHCHRRRRNKLSALFTRWGQVASTPMACHGIGDLGLHPVYVQKSQNFKLLGTARPAVLQILGMLSRFSTTHIVRHGSHSPPRLHPVAFPILFHFAECRREGVRGPIPSQRLATRHSRLHLGHSRPRRSRQNPGLLDQ